jgi:hypothetical protein
MAALIPQRPRVNPLSRQPRQQRLVLAVRGGAGVGKSHFVRSMADAGLGRLCVFDMERKARLLKGVGVDFDGLELEHPDELPEFIDWALHGEGKAQNYGCFALDSWAAYFGAKHSETIAAVRARTGDPLAQPSAEELAADQMVLQNVLRRLCMESGKSVVIVDQIPARGKEAKEDNEVGRVLPMTASGLEYFVDVMAEVSLQERNGEIVRVFQIVKSNCDAFEVGFELVGNVTFRDFLEQLRGHGPGPDALPLAAPRPSAVPELLDDAAAAPVAPPRLTLEELLAKAERFGFRHADIVKVARVYHAQDNIYRLTPDQIADLDRRLMAKVNAAGAAAAAPPPGAPSAPPPSGNTMNTPGTLQAAAALHAAHAAVPRPGVTSAVS